MKPNKSRSTVCLGYPVARHIEHSTGTQPILIVTCEECGFSWERKYRSVYGSKRLKRRMICESCRLKWDWMKEQKKKAGMNV